MLMSTTVPLLAGISTELDCTISAILSRGDDTLENLTENLIQLTKFVKVKITLDKAIRLDNRNGKNLSEVVIGKFFKGRDVRGSAGFLAYSTRHKNVRSGYICPWVQNIKSYEPVIGKLPENKVFASYESFAKKFDTRFISEDLIKKLYTEKSAQTGERYTPHDFKPIGPRGKTVVQEFLRKFKSITEETPYYLDRSIGDHKFKEVNAHHKSYSHTGRDIDISHTLGQDKVYYMSQFPGCGNGQYGLLATENTWLHLEND